MNPWIGFGGGDPYGDDYQSSGSSDTDTSGPDTSTAREQENDGRDKADTSNQNTGDSKGGGSKG